MDLQQLLFRPTPSLYGTPQSNLYLCEHPLPLVGVSTGWPGIMLLRRHLRIRIVNLQLVKLCLALLKTEIDY